VWSAFAWHANAHTAQYDSDPHGLEEYEVESVDGVLGRSGADAWQIRVTANQYSLLLRPLLVPPPSAVARGRPPLSSIASYGFGLS
jgi:hypothetical protein